MIDINNFDAIEIGLASSKQIRSWSSGEVTKPETINYRTLKPEKDGLFCERIFGPTKDWECYCGKYKRVRYKGIVCERCGVEVTRSKVRRERMGHVDLAAPVSHIWFFKGVPSRIGYLLDMAPKELEKVLYFAASMVTWVDDEARARGVDGLLDEVNKVLDAYAAEKEERVLELKESLARREEFLESAKTGRDFSDEDHLWAETLEGNVAKLSAEEREKMLKELRKSFQADIDDTEAYIEDAAERMRQVWDLFQTMKPKDVINDETTFRELKDRFGSPYGFGEYFRGGMGAEAVRDLLQQVDLEDESADLQEQVKTAKGQKQARAVKRLKVVSAFISSGNKPEMMILEAVPVIPPELRPMVQLDGGRFATSDLNDLYRRVINSNNRLKRLLELGAPEIIVRNEKRMLQEAVDALIDNGRRGRAITGTGNRKLKSLSDMLKGKQGRFRQNLLGKRVDYSGRSVIVVGPELKLHQCGLPKKMALELFKPFVMKRLVDLNHAQNIKSAKRMVERVRPEVWDVLDQVITDHPVLLNRAPTLHRLGIQAFMPVLVEGQAIQIHPLVCKAFNADFDGDQMAVHVPLFSGAVAEAKNLMMSSNNILSASDGRPVVTPSQDIVLGSYYLTQEMTELPTAAEEVGRLQAFSSAEEAELAYEHKCIGLHDHIRVRMPKHHVVSFRASEAAPEGTSLVATTVGRVLFNAVLPLGEPGTHSDLPSITFRNEVMDLRKLGQLVKECYDLHGSERTAQIANDIKRLGFHYATKAGVTVSAMDIKTPGAKAGILAAAEKQVEDVDLQYRRGLITDDERYLKTVEIWTKATDDVTEVTMKSFDRFHSVLMMSQSGARGSTQQIRQIAGMRGLMADPTGRIIDLPIKANFSEGLNVLEYFISTHGARKGLADTALRTADSGYLTRRLVDVAQDVIVRIDDCETTAGIWVDLEDPLLGDRTMDRIAGRIASQDVVLEGETVTVSGEEISDEVSRRAFALRADAPRIKVRSIMTCKAREGVCRLCYGRNLATGRLVEIGEAVGVIAAQSIGEPGTQLTMRTFHTGGVATGGSDITQGLPRVEELFEARVPKGKALISETDGEVEIIRTEAKSIKVKVTSRDVFDTTYPIPPKHSVLVGTAEAVAENAELLRGTDENGNEVIVRAKYAGVAKVAKSEILVRTSEEETHEYAVPAAAQLIVRDGDHVVAGDRITQGSISPQELLLVRGREDVQNYLVREVQSVYRSQGVDINDKHIEVIVRQMMRKVRIDNAGDTDLLPGEIVSQFEWEESNARALSEGGEPAIAGTVLLGLIKAALNTASWLSAASFQETTRVLTEAAISGKVDKLRGLKENVIIGKLIPAGTGLDYYQKLREEAARLYEEEEAAAALAALTPDDADSDDGDDIELTPTRFGVESATLPEEVPTATA